MVLSCCFRHFQVIIVRNDVTLTHLEQAHMSQQDSLLGKQLNEYRLEKLLGQGGMARVYRAIDTQLKRYVAIKVIDNKFRTDEEYVRRFEREAQAIARFDHPHVVSLH